MTIITNIAAYAPSWEGYSEITEVTVAVKRGDWLIEDTRRPDMTELELARAEIALLRAQLEEEREERERDAFLKGQREVLLSLDPADDRDDIYIPGAGEYDTRDSRGRKLRPTIDPDSGEPWWM